MTEWTFLFMQWFIIVACVVSVLDPDEWGRDEGTHGVACREGRATRGVSDRPMCSIHGVLRED